jgi:hypothetical protein
MCFPPSMYVASIGIVVMEFVCGLRAAAACRGGGTGEVGCCVEAVVQLNSEGGMIQ